MRRRPSHRTTRRGFLASAAGAAGALGGLQATPARDVVPGVATFRPIPGEPCDLAGTRIVFTDWRFIRPGDLDWTNAQGQSVYVTGSEGPWGATYRGIETPRGIRIEARPADRVIKASRPGRMRQDDGVLRAWTGKYYQESRDGLKWETKAEMVDPPDFGREVNVFIDPDGPPAERHRCVWADSLTAEEFAAYRQRRPDDWEPRALLHLAESGRVACIKGAVSPDGIAWTTLPEPLVVEYSDTEIVGYYDAARQRSVLYTRQWSVAPYTRTRPADIRHSWTAVGRRAIGRTESADFRRFPPSRLIVEPGPELAPSDQLYTNCRTAVPGAPDHHLMFPAVWHTDRDTTSIILLASADGETWHRVPGGPVLKTAVFGEWNGGCVWTSPSLVELPNGDWALPYRGDNVPHKYPRGQRVAEEGYAIWTRGRLAAVVADDRGEFSTLAIVPPGRRLRVNAVTERVGSITVEVAGAEGHTFAGCRPLAGDCHWTPVTWGGQEDMGVPAGAPVMLRFRLDRARLYGIEFA